MQTVLTVAGYAIGSYFGYPQLGAVVGAAVGGYLGAPDVEGPRLTGGAPRNVEYGWPIRRIYGRRRVADPFKAWQSPLIETAHEQDAKGGPEQTTYSYSTHVRFLICKRGPVAVTRIWINKELRWTALASSDEASLRASATTDAFASITFMDGNPAQMPWSIEETYEGAENVTAARGLCCVCIESLQHGFSETPPLVEIEVVELADVATFGDGLLCHFDSEAGGIVPSALGPDVTLGAGNSIEPGGGPFAGAAEASQVAGPYPSAIGVTGSTTRSWRMEVIFEPTIASGPIFSLSSTATGYHIDISAVIGTAALGVNYVAEGSSGGGVIGSSAAGPQLGQRNHVGVEYEEGSNMLYLFCNSSRVGQLGPFAGNPFGGAVFDTVYVGGCGLFYEAYFHFDAELYGEAYSVPTGPFSAANITTYAPLPSDLADIVAAELQEAGLDSSQFDVSALEGIEVLGFDTIYSPRQGIEQLMLTHNFDWVCGAALKAVLLGGASTATIPYADLGAGVDQADPECFNPEYGNDKEVPAKRALAYININDDGAIGVAYQDREVSYSAELRRDSVNVAMVPTRAQGVVDTMVARARVEATRATFKLTDKHVQRECTDVVTLLDEDGSSSRKRITQDTYSRGVHAFESVLDDQLAYRTEGITLDTFEETVTVPSPVETEMVLMDIAPLRDSEVDSPGHLVAATGTSSASWPGASIQRALVAGGERTEVAQVLERAVLGRALTALSANPPLWRVDRYGTLEVRVLGALSSSTPAAMQADRTINSLAVETSDGACEVIRFELAELIDTEGEYRMYRLSRLRRGRRGTEQLVGLHAVGDRVVLLRAAGIRNVATEPVDLGVTRYYRAATTGRSAADADEEAFADSGSRMKPFAPTRLRMRVSGGRNVFTWRRRSRRLPRYGGVGGSLVPLGETTEAYDVELRDGSDALVQSATVTEQEWSLSALQQGVHLLVPSWGLRVISGELVGVRDDVLGTYTTTKYLVRHDAATGVFIAQSPAVGEEVYQIVNSGNDIYLVVADYTNTVPVAWASTSLLKFNRTSLGSATASYTSATPGDFQGVAFDGTNVWVTESLTGQLRRFNTSLASTGTFAINAGITALVHDSGSLWICDVANDELVEWDIATTTELQRFPVTPNPFDVLIVGSRAFVFGTTGLGVYDTADGSVIVEHSTPPVFFAGAQAQRQMLLFDGYVAIAGSDSGHLVILHDAVTGAEVSRSASSYESLSYLAGSDGDTLYLTGEPVAPGSTSKQTDGFTFENADLSGYSFTVAQRSAVVGRGYSTTITL